MAERSQPPDREFVATLRSTLDRYFAAVDAWDAAYQKYYRLPGFASRIGDDLAAEQSAYDAARREFEAMLPRARRLCLKHNLRDSFSGLLRVSLGRYAPQERVDPSIGRSERSAAAKCLIELHDACQEWELQSVESAPKPSLLRRLVGYFYTF